MEHLIPNCIAPSGSSSTASLSPWHPQEHFPEQLNLIKIRKENNLGKIVILVDKLEDILEYVAKRGKGWYCQAIRKSGQCQGMSSRDYRGDATPWEKVSVHIDSSFLNIRQYLGLSNINQDLRSLRWVYYTAVSPSSLGDMFQEPKWMPKTTNSTRLYRCYVFPIVTHL